MDVNEPYEGQRFASFDALKKYLEEYGKRNYVKYWTRSSHTINSLKSKSKRFNPELKYACMKFACIFGGEKTRCRGSGIRRSTTYRNLGCPFTINAVVGEDGNHVKLETVILDHNHSLGKSLYDSLKKSKNKMKILQNEIDNCDTTRRIFPRSSPLRGVRGTTTRRERVTFSHLEILRPHGSRKGLIRTDSAMAARLAASETFQVCIREMQAKYGPNIKILIVNRNEPEEQRVEERTCQEIDENQLSQLRRQFEESERIRNSRFSQICRLCLSSTNELHPIFYPSEPLESTIRSFKIMSCASIDVSKDDGLPGNICTVCEEQLDLAYNFRIRSENADTFLRQSNPVNEYVNANEIPLLNAEDLQEIEPCEQEEAQDLVEPEEQIVVESSLLTQENIINLDPTKNIIFDEEQEVYAEFEDSCPICGYNFGTYTNMLQHHTNITCAPFKSNPVLISIIALNIALNLVYASQKMFNEPRAEERKFFHKTNLSPLALKKDWLLSLFSRPHSEVKTVHNLPIWKIHKYKGVELRPVQIVDVPVTYDYLQPIAHDPPPVRVPHTEYGVPSLPPTEYQTEYQAPLVTSELPGPKFQHGQKFTSFLSALRSHKSLLKNLKDWKFGKLRSHPGYVVALPEAEEVPVKGLENINVPELPQINLPYYGSTFSTGPYLSVTYANPLQQPTYQEPVPYYGAPPLYDSYGTPLPPDAYSSAPSQPVPSFAAPETLHVDYKPKTQDTLNEPSLLQEVPIKKSDQEVELNQQESEETNPEEGKEIP